MSEKDVSKDASVNSKNSRWWNIVSDWPYSSRVATGVVTIGNIFGGFSLKKEWGIWVWIWYSLAFIAIILTVVFDMTKEKTLTKLKKIESENSDLKEDLDEVRGEFKQMMAAEIRRIAKELKFNGCDRISVHSYNEESENWLLLDRFTHNNIDYNKRNDKAIPNFGFLKMAYKSKDGYFHWNRKFPHPVLMKREMKKLLEKEGCYNEFCEKLSMDSKTYYTHAISTSMGRSAVVTVESTEYQRWNGEKIEQIMADSVSRMSSFVSRVTPVESVDLAKNIGL